VGVVLWMILSRESLKGVDYHIWWCERW